MKPLYNHQQQIIAHDPLKSLLSLGTGSGKTRIFLELAEGNTVILCPKQQKLEMKYSKTLEEFNIKRSISVYSKEEWRNIFDVHLGCDTLIIDESHFFVGIEPTTRKRNGVTIPKTSQIYEATKRYIDKVKPHRIYLASATPAPTPLAVWGIAGLLGLREKVLDKIYNYYDFRSAFYTERNIGGRRIWISKKDKNSNELLAGYIKKMGYTGRLEDWFDVPPQVHKTIYVPLTEAQQNRITEIKKSEADPMVRRTKLRGVENGIEYVMKLETVNDKVTYVVKDTKYYGSEKIKEIIQLAKEFPKMLVFANYTAQIHDISKALEKEGYKVYTLTGKTKNRKDLIEQADKEDCIVVVQASISYGYELKTFRCIVFASKNYKYIDYEQALGRTLRVDNLQKNLFVHLLVRGVDEECHKTILKSKDFNEKIYE